MGEGFRAGEPSKDRVLLLGRGNTALVNTETQKSFWQVYFLDARALVLLLAVCAAIAVFANLLNDAGFLINYWFSLSFGVPISMIETWLRTRPWRLSSFVINGLAWWLGCCVGSLNIYFYLVHMGMIEWGVFNKELLYNLVFGFVISGVAFHFFWSHYRTHHLTLALKEQELKATQAEAARTQAEYRLLQSQMEPHFLFNTLATIQTLIDLDSAKAKAMVGDLSTLLRSAIKNSQSSRCRLDEELALAQSYLNIQQVRAGERIEYRQRVDPDCRAFQTLPMLLQPIFENSIKHGLDQSTGNMQLALSVERDGNDLVMMIENRVSNSRPSTRSIGLSLNNIQRRLDLAYGERATFSSAATEQGWSTMIRHPAEEDAS